MFLKVKKSGYNRDGEQFCSGLFVILMQPNECPEYPTVKEQCDAPVRCIVRFTTFRQFGNFVMGFARVRGARVTLSGAYGSDGLTKSMPVDIYRRGLELPAELREAWNSGGGWNCSGMEAPSIQKWAISNIKALRG